MCGGIGRFLQHLWTHHAVQICVLPCRCLRGSTNGEGGDATISSPGRSAKQSLPEIGLHDPLHSRQACPEFIAFDQGVGQICLR